MSKEHLWPDWALRTFPPDEQKRIVEHSFERHDAPTEYFHAPVFSATLKDVCESCNNGWMSNIEARAGGIATPMVRGEERTLDPRDQGILAGWAYMKVLLQERVDDRQRLLPAKHYRELYEARVDPVLPESVKVYTAAYQGPREGQYAHRGLTFRDTEGRNIDAYLGTFTIRHLILQVFEDFAHPEPVEVARRRRLRKRQRRIFPATETFTWPPGRPLRDCDLALFAGPEP